MKLLTKDFKEKQSPFLISTFKISGLPSKYSSQPGLGRKGGRSLKTEKSPVLKKVG